MIAKVLDWLGFGSHGHDHDHDHASAVRHLIFAYFDGDRLRGRNMAALGMMPERQQRIAFGVVTRAAPGRQSYRTARKPRTAGSMPSPALPSRPSPILT